MIKVMGWVSGEWNKKFGNFYGLKVIKNGEVVSSLEWMSLVKNLSLIRKKVFHFTYDKKLCMWC